MPTKNSVSIGSGKDLSHVWHKATIGIYAGADL